MSGITNSSFGRPTGPEGFGFWLDELETAMPKLPDALCTQVDVGDIFFPEKGTIPTAAKLICSRCPERERCLEYAVTYPERLYGIWGGTSERERRRIRAERGIQEQRKPPFEPQARKPMNLSDEERARRGERLRQANLRRRRRQAEDAA